MLSQLDEQPMLRLESATGEPIHDAPAAVRTHNAYTVRPIRFRILSYADQTIQLYDGDTRETADTIWNTVEHGIFLGVDSEHAWCAIDRR